MTMVMRMLAVFVHAFPAKYDDHDDLDEAMSGLVSPVASLSISRHVTKPHSHRNALADYSVDCESVLDHAAGRDGLAYLTTTSNMEQVRELQAGGTVDTGGNPSFNG
jgi:hypothetical protein